MKKVLILLLALSLTGCANSTEEAAAPGKVIDCSSIKHVTDTTDAKVIDCLDGSTGFSIASLRGPLVVNVWGSWCGPCKQEMPYFVDFYQRANGKVDLLGIAVEESSARNPKEFIVNNGMSWPNLFDADGSTREDFGMGVPVTWFIDEEGTVTYKHVGPIPSTIELIKLTAKYLKVNI